MSRPRRINLNAVVENASHFISLGACAALEDLIVILKSALPQDVLAQVLPIVHKRMIEHSEDYKSTERQS